MGKEIVPGKDKTDKEDMDVEEIFTDLHGNFEPETDDDAKILETIDDDEGEPLLDDEAGEGEGEETQQGDADGTANLEDDAPGPDPREIENRQLKLENIGLQAQQLDDREAFAKGKKGDAERTLESSTAAIKAAKEAGDTDAEMKAQKDYLDARDTIAKSDQALSFIEGARRGLRGELDKIGFDPKTNSFKEGPEPAARGTALPDTTKKFLAANKWFNDPRFKTSADLMRSLDNDLAAEKKLKVCSTEYYAELTTRFNRVKPGLARGLDGKLVATGARQRGTGQGQSSVSPSSGARQRPVDVKGIKLDRSDLENMRTFQMDTSDPKQRAAYLREKRADAQRATRH